MIQTDAIKVGAVVPLSGPSGIFGPSCCNCFRLAAEQINDQGGILGQKIELVFIDGGQKPADVAANVKTFLDLNLFSALIGMHDSDVRRALIEVLDQKIPYIYTPTYEGGETSKETFLLGETPAQQLKPAIKWLKNNRDIKSWYLLGNDYSWPYKLHEAAKRYISHYDVQVVGERYVAQDTENFDEYISEISEINPDCILVSLTGTSSVKFNRSFYEKGLSDHILRLSTLFEENILLASGAEACEGLLASSGYYPNLKTPQNDQFIKSYYAKFGQNAPALNSLSQSCYEGLLFLQKLAEKANSFKVGKMLSASEGLSYEGPRGVMKMQDRHVHKTIYLAQADGYHFQILEKFENIAPYSR